MKRGRSFEVLLDPGADPVTFNFDELLPELKGEMDQRMTSTARLLMAFTSKANAAFFKNRKPTYLLMEQAVSENCDYAFYQKLSEYFNFKDKSTDSNLVEAAIRSNNIDFLVGFLAEHHEVKEFLKTQELRERILVVLARMGSYEVLQNLWFIVGDNPDDILQARTIVAGAAAVYSNMVLLRQLREHWGNFLPPGPRQENFLCYAFASGNEQVLSEVQALFGLDLEMVRDRRFPVPVEIVPYPLGALRKMKELNCFPTASIIIISALKHNDAAALKFALEEMGWKLTVTELLLRCFNAQSSRELWDMVLDNAHYYRVNKPIDTLDESVTIEGAKYFIEKGLLKPEMVKKFSTKSSFAFLTFLHNNGFNVPHTALLFSAIRQNKVNTLHEKVLQGPTGYLSVLELPNIPRGPVVLRIFMDATAPSVFRYLYETQYFTTVDLLTVVQAHLLLLTERRHTQLNARTACGLTLIGDLMRILALNVDDNHYYLILEKLVRAVPVLELGPQPSGYELLVVQQLYHTYFDIVFASPIRSKMQTPVVEMLLQNVNMPANCAVYLSQIGSLAELRRNSSI